MSESLSVMYGYSISELPPAYAGNFLRVYWNIQTRFSQIIGKLLIACPQTQHVLDVLRSLISITFLPARFAL